MMFCFAHRWSISRSMDSGRALSNRTAKHVGRCAACREFRDRCASLAERLAADAHAAAGEVSPELHAKILKRSLGVAPGPARRRRLDPTRGTARRLRIGLAFAAAAVLLLGVVGAWFAMRPRQTLTPPIVERNEPVRYLVSGRVIADVVEVGNAIEDPLAKEMRLLEADGKAAVEFLASCVPIGLEFVGRSSPTSRGAGG
jgi:hypothetical protein